MTTSPWRRRKEGMLEGNGGDAATGEGAPGLRPRHSLSMLCLRAAGTASGPPATLRGDEITTAGVDRRSMRSEGAAAAAGDEHAPFRDGTNCDAARSGTPAAVQTHTLKNGLRIEHGSLRTEYRALPFAQKRRREAQCAAVFSVGHSCPPPTKQRVVHLSWTDLNVRAVVGSEKAWRVADISAANFKKEVRNSSPHGGAVSAPPGQTRGTTGTRTGAANPL